MRLVEREAQRLIARYRTLFPAVGLIGPRQSGKTTLARRVIAESTHSVTYFDLERQADFAATAEVDLFLDGLEHDLVVIDEVQRRPELFVGLRSAIDADRREGRFLLLGSASPELMRESSESLAGRIGYVELPPLSLREISGTYDRTTHWRRGGFPNSLRLDDEDSMLWRDNFVRTYLERDIRELRPNIDAGALARMLPMLAHVHAEPVNYSMLAKSLSLTSPTVKRYLELLEASFFVRLLPPYFTNTRKRLAKRPKVFVRDSGLLHNLLGVSTQAQLLRHPKLGASWEGYVVEQVCQALPPGTRPYTYRSADGADLDLVLLPRGGGGPIAVEIKLSDAPTLSRGNREAIAAVAPDVTYVVTPGARASRRADGILMRNLEDLLQELPGRLAG